MADKHQHHDHSADDAAQDTTAADDSPSSGDNAGELRAQLNEARDRALRVQAEWENFRKRARRDLDEERRYADLRMLGDLLPVLDNMQRAIDAASKSGSEGGLLEGFKIVKQQLDNVLQQHSCTRIDALHKPFDPHQHEAIMQQPTTEFPANTVMAVAQDGYMLHDRVVRPAQVVVAAAPPS